MKVGALYSLLRDRLVDARRSEFRLASNDIDIARFEAKATGIGVQARAVEAYQKWVGAGLKLKAYEALLALADGGDYTKVTYLHGKGERIANVTRQVGS